MPKTKTCSLMGLMLAVGLAGCTTPHSRYTTPAATAADGTAEVLTTGAWAQYTDAGKRAYQQGRYGEAEAHFVAAVQEAEKLPPQDPRLALSLNNLGAVYSTQENYAAAEPLYTRSLAIMERVRGGEHPDVAATLNNLGMLYDLQGKYAQAEPLYRRALAIDEKVLGPEHAEVATDLNNLASLYDTMGRYAEAEQLYRRALAIDEKVLGPDHRNVVTDLENYAALLRKMNRAAEAEPLEARAEAIRARQGEHE